MIAPRPGWAVHRVPPDPGAVLIERSGDALAVVPHGEAVDLWYVRAGGAFWVTVLDAEETIRLARSLAVAAGWAWPAHWRWPREVKDGR